MRAAAWAALAVLAFVLAVVLLAGALTRFDDGPVPPDPASARRYQEEQYTAARVGTALGVAAAFALLGGAACAQKAWSARKRSSLAGQ